MPHAPQPQQTSKYEDNSPESSVSSAGAIVPLSSRKAHPKNKINSAVCRFQRAMEVGGADIASNDHMARREHNPRTHVGAHRHAPFRLSLPLLAGSLLAGLTMVSCSSSPAAVERVAMPEEPSCTSNKDCDPGFYCETSVGECLSAVLERCEYRPLTDGFRIREEWAWSQDAEVLPEYNQIMMTPMVANLTDDNGDGEINADDVPDVVFHTFTGFNYLTDGVIRAVSGDSGARVWPAAEPGFRTNPGSHIAIADVDPASPGPEVMACEVWAPNPAMPGATQGALVILKADGSVLHRTREVTGQNCFAPSVADLDGDGNPEIVDGRKIFRGDGTELRSLPAGASTSALVNIDDDEDLEIIFSDRAYNHDGSLVWERAAGEPGPVRGIVAIADLDATGDGAEPELIVMDGSTHSLWAFDAGTGAHRWGPSDINPAGVSHEKGIHGGGPPLIANFDDDPNPEIGVAGGFAYTVFGHDGARQWLKNTNDLSSRGTGSSVFDFEGDGVAEVLYNDELNFHVYKGLDGADLLKQCNTSGTLSEFPIVVDVDNDARAEVVLMGNNYGNQSCADGNPSGNGIRVLGHPEGEWVGSRRIYNQFSYHVTNINEDGTVPKREDPHYRLPLTNSFRQNIALFDVPDLIAEDIEVGTGMCPEHLDVSVNIINRGAAVSAPNVPVSFFIVGDDNTRTFAGQGKTSKRLKPGEFERVSFAYPVPEEQLDAELRFIAAINHPDHEPLTEFRECHTDNNDSDTAANECKALF